MVFSGSAHATAAVAPLDLAAMVRPLPRPHVQHHDDRLVLYGGGSARAGVDTKHHPSYSHPHETTDLFGPLTTLAAAVGAVPSLQIDTGGSVTSTASKSAKKKTKKSLSPSASTASADSDSRSIVPLNVNAKTAKKLSTERSRLCRQRQKSHADTLEMAVAALRAEVANLVTRRDLRREQIVHTPASRSGSLARIVQEYCSVFQYGMAPESHTALTSRKRSLASSRQLTAHEQCDFLLSMMDPDVQVFDWIGRSKRGPDPLVHGWKAWSKWHASIMFHLEAVDVIANDDEGMIAVSTRGKICVKVSQKTIEQLFPHAAQDDAICARLLGSEIQYPVRDTFYFNETGRVAMYTVDMDCVAALNNVVGDFRAVATLVAPPHEDITFNDRAISTYDDCSLERACEARAQLPQSPQKPLYEAKPSRDQRLDLQFLLS